MASALPGRRMLPHLHTDPSITAQPRHEGMHNWLQIYQEERAGRLDYKGYIPPRSSGRRGSALSARDTEQLVTIQFSWTDPEDGSDDLKPVSTMFVGVCPAFELALYTLLYLDGSQEKTTVQCGQYKTVITIFKNVRAPLVAPHV